MNKWGLTVRFILAQLSESEENLRTEVREFLAMELPRGSYRPDLLGNDVANADDVFGWAPPRSRRDRIGL